MKIIDNVTAYFSRASLGSTQAFGEYAGRVVSCISEKSSTSAISGLFFASTVLAFIAYKSRYCSNNVSIERDNAPVQPFEPDEDVGEPTKIVGESEDDGVFANQDFDADLVDSSEDTAANSPSSQDVGDSGFQSTNWSLVSLITQIKETVFGKSVTSHQVTQGITTDLDEGSERVFEGDIMMLNALQLGEMSVGEYLDQYDRIEAKHVIYNGSKYSKDGYIKKTTQQVIEDLKTINEKLDKFPNLGSIKLADTPIDKFSGTYFDDEENFCYMVRSNDQVMINHLNSLGKPIPTEDTIPKERETLQFLKSLFPNKKISFLISIIADYSNNSLNAKFRPLC